MKDVLPEGKLPRKLLERLLVYTSRSPMLAVGAACGEDAAVARGARTIVITADPITFTEEEIGAYVVAVNANDVVAMGGQPRYLTTTILLPPGTRASRVEEIFKEISESCGKAGVLWAGGHTEVTPAVRRIVVSGHAVGVLKGRPLSTGGARAGDAICMTKWVGLEGTTLIARERPAECRKILGASRFKDVRGWLSNPGISIVGEGRALSGFRLSSGHDPTEGGVAMGIHEVCQAGGVGCLIRHESLPIREETLLVCGRFRLDPLGLLSSGVFLFTAPPKTAERAMERLSRAGIPAARIGEVRPASDGILIERAGKTRPLRASVQDEMVKMKAAR